jgi:chromosome segregation ATPase
MKLLNVASTANGKYAATFEVDDLLDLIHLLAAAGGPTLTDSFARLESDMATAAKKLADLEKAIDEFDEREALEDAEHAMSKAEVARLTDELRVLQERLDAGELSQELEARMEALIGRIRASNVIPDEVLPGE